MSRHSIPSDWLNASYLEQKPPGAQCLGGFSVSALRVVDRKLFDVTRFDVRHGEWSRRDASNIDGQSREAETSVKE